LAEKKQNYLHGASILAAGVVIMKILGAVYKLPLVRIIGVEANGYFNVAYVIYQVMLTVSTAGLPVALSRMISEATTLGRDAQAKKIFNVSMTTFIIIGSVFSALMFLFPTELAILMKRPEAAQSIRVLSASLLPVCIASAYRGYMQGHSNMIPTTVSQVLEVLAKVIVGLAAAWLLVRAGRSDPITAAGAVIGVVIGSFAALICLLFYYRRDYNRKIAASSEKTDSAGVILKKLMKIGIPITLGASVMSVISMIDTSLVNMQLEANAAILAETPSTLWGTYSALFPLYNLPSAFITPLTISVVPAIVSHMTNKQHREAGLVASSSLRITSIIAFPMGVGLAVVPGPIIKLLLPTVTSETAPLLLTILGIASFFVCISLVSNAILQASGHEKYPIISMLIAGAIKIGANLVLVGNPKFNIYGAPIGSILCFAVICVLNWFFMRKCMPVRPRFSDTMLKPIVSSVVMGGGAWAVYGLASKLLASGGELSKISMLFSLVAAVGTGVVLYLVMIITTKAITLDDMKLIPGGEKAAKLLKIK